MSILTKTVSGVLDSRRYTCVTFGEGPGMDYSGVTFDNWMVTEPNAGAVDDYNEGASESLQIGFIYVSKSEWYIRRGLLKFDISSLPASVDIISATLYFNAFAFGEIPITAYRVLRDWGEGDNNGTNADPGESSWNDYSAPNPWTTGGCGDDTTDRAASPSWNVTIDPTGWYEVDVTDSIREFYDGTYNNYGWLLKASDDVENGLEGTNAYASIRSSEFTIFPEQRPYLKICYKSSSAPAPTPCTPETRDTLTEVAPALNGGIIYSLRSFGGNLYGTDGGILQQWNGTDAWAQVAPQFGSVTDVRGLIEYDGELYGGGNNENLLKWNGVDAWVSVGSGGGTKDCWGGMVVHNTNLYVTFDGDLYEWDGVAFSKVADEPVGGIRAYDLISSGGQLYMCPYGAGAGGYLWRWNGSAWVSVHDNTNLGTTPTYFVEISGKFYVCNDGGTVYSTDGTGWTEEDDIPNQNFTQRAAVQNSTIYVCSDFTSRLGRWNEPCGGEDVVTAGSGNVKSSIVVHNGEIFCGTQNGKLERFD